ncbi:MAG: hypothetical protein Q7S56_00505 [Nanoarchaeota archaeon]|nr:hypothetical protein [Nanoarchaeota archaeon]
MRSLEDIRKDLEDNNNKKTNLELEEFKAVKLREFQEVFDTIIKIPENRLPYISEITQFSLILAHLGSEGNDVNTYLKEEGKSAEYFKWEEGVSEKDDKINHALKYLALIKKDELSSKIYQCVQNPNTNESSKYESGSCIEYACRKTIERLLLRQLKEDEYNGMLEGDIPIGTLFRKGYDVKEKHIYLKPKREEPKKKGLRQRLYDLFHAH